MEMNKNTEPLYPIIQSDSIPNQEKISFRLNKITDIQNLLENNIRDRRSLNKKILKSIESFKCYGNKFNNSFYWYG